MGLFGTSKPWLKRHYKQKEFRMSLRYLISHLDKHDQQKIKGKNHFGLSNDWQDKKVKAVIENITKHKHRPIQAALHEKKEEFRIEDGISRIIAFKKEEISHINVILRVAEW